MKLQKTLILIPLLILIGCAGQINENEQTNVLIPIIPIDHDYSEVKEFSLSWSEIFNPKEEKYFVYFYSTTCSHCQDLKNTIIEKALQEKNIYFVQNSRDVVLSENTFSTLGLSSIENLSILGYPSCLKIENHVISKNVAGKTQIIDLLNNN